MPRTPDELCAFLAAGGLGGPWVMGVVNATPDSFSDGGRHLAAADAADAVRRLADDGADVIDVGGESTRPGSDPVPPSEQIRRVLPALRAAGALGVAASIDTASAQVAAAALDEGATLINDVTAGQGDAALLPLAARCGAAVVLMHMRGTPKTMQDAPAYADVTAEVLAFLNARRAAAVAAGVDPAGIVLDPGIGFGKTLGHNLRLLRDLQQFVAAGPTLLGASRKGFLGKITGEPAADRRGPATDATTAHATRCGCALVRVHDARAARHVVDVTRAILDAA